MRYSLAIYKDGADVIELENYGFILANEDFNENALDDIINFTNTFVDEEELTEVLLHAGMIPKEYLDASYGIRYYRGKDSAPKLLQYGISFKRDKKFFNKEFLQNYFSSHLTNARFMEAFLEKYYNYLKDIPIFSSDLQDIRYGYMTYIEEGILPLETNQYMANFINNYTRKKDSKGNYKDSTSRIRDLAMFAIDFERIYNRKKEQNRFKNPNYIKNLEMQLEHYDILINEPGITIEEYEAYLREIDKITAELEIVSDKDYTRTRRIDDDEFTEY